MKKLIVPVILAGFVIGLVAAPSIAQQAKEPAPQKQPSARVIIPKDVKDALNAGLPARQGRQDIPFTIFKSTYLPAQQAFYIILIAKMKNADLGFAPAPPSQVADVAAPAGNKLRATFDMFLDFHKIENGAPLPASKEVYIPVTLEQDAAGFDPAKKYPLYVQVYGGPSHRNSNSYQTAGPKAQLAQLGYLVWELDGRGTTRRGK